MKDVSLRGDPSLTLRMTEWGIPLVILNEGCRSEGSTRSDFCVYPTPALSKGEGFLKAESFPAPLFFSLPLPPFRGERVRVRGSREKLRPLEHPLQRGRHLAQRRHAMRMDHARADP